MAHHETEIAEYLMEKYPALELFQALELAVGIRKNELTALAYGVGRKDNGPGSLEYIGMQLDSIATAISER